MGQVLHATALDAARGPSGNTALDGFSRGIE